MYNPIHSDPTRTNAERSTVVAPTPPIQEQDAEEVAQPALTSQEKILERLQFIDSLMEQAGLYIDELVQLDNQPEYALQCNYLRQARGDVGKAVKGFTEYMSLPVSTTEEGSK